METYLLSLNISKDKTQELIKELNKIINKNSIDHYSKPSLLKYNIDEKKMSEIKNYDNKKNISTDNEIQTNLNKNGLFYNTESLILELFSNLLKKYDIEKSLKILTNLESFLENDNIPNFLI